MQSLADATPQIALGALDGGHGRDAGATGPRSGASSSGGGREGTHRADAAGRAFAAYGGVYIAASLFWLWAVEGRAPTLQDLGGAALMERRGAVKSAVLWRVWNSTLEKWCRDRGIDRRRPLPAR